MVQLLDIKPAGHVLKIGFGGGAAIELTTELANADSVAGIEVSNVMLKI